MAPTDEEKLGREARRLRLNTLVGLRWLAVAGQAAAILAGVFIFRLKFPVLTCIGLVAASAVVNLALRWRYPVSTQLNERGAAALLAYDILQLSGLLFLTGGIANPFSILMLAPVTIASTSLSLRDAVGLLALTLICATALLNASLPLPWIGGENLGLPAMYVLAAMDRARGQRRLRHLICLSSRSGGEADGERPHGRRTGSRPRAASFADRRPCRGGRT